MLVFNNQQRSGYEEIASYSPRFYRSIKEMDAVFRFAGFTLDLMAEDLESTVSNQFVEYMDEESFSRYEVFLGVKKDINKTLEERKAYVNALLVGSGKISKDKIVAIVNQFVDCACDVSLDGSELFINMTFSDDPGKYMDDIRNLIRDKVPLHIEIVYHGSVDIDIVVILKDTVTIERIRHGMAFYLYSNTNVDYLDGSRYLDGSMLLGNVLDLFPVRDRYPIGVHEENHVEIEHITIRKNMHRLDGSLVLNGSTKLNAKEWKEDIDV